MSLTPDEIVNYPLKQAVRGYAVKQVDELLDQVADTLERAQAETVELRQRLVRSEQQLASASETEATLKRTLVTAQRAAEQSLEEAKTRAAELVDDARRESAAIVEQAKLEAEELRMEAVRAARAEEAEIRRRRQALEQHIEQLRIFEREYRSRLRGLLDEQLRLLDDIQTRPPSPPQEPDAPGADGSTSSASSSEPVTPSMEEMRDDMSNLEGVSAEGERGLTVRIREDRDPAVEREDPDEDQLFATADTGTADPTDPSTSEPGTEREGD